MLYEAISVLETRGADTIVTERVLPPAFIPRIHMAYKKGPILSQFTRLCSSAQSQDNRFRCTSIQSLFDRVSLLGIRVLLGC